MASGLFARYGLRVELVAPVRRSASAPAGPAVDQPEFALVSAYSRLAALSRPGAGGAAGRFVGVVHQRSPLAAFVPVDSPLREPAQLGGRRVAASTVPWFDHEYRSGLLALGLRPPVVVQPRPDGERPSLATGEVDVIGSWAESIGPMRRRAGVAVRSIPFGPAVYTMGLVAADRVAPALAARMVDALAAAYLQQRDAPGLGIDELTLRFPQVAAADALEEWAILDEYVFGGYRPLVMHAARWEATVAQATFAHGFPPVPVERLCRPELLTPSPAMAGAATG